MSAKPVIAISKTPLWTESEPEERFLLAGKIHNLRLATDELNGLEINEGDTFSFWKQVGRTSRFRGFVRGRELREGCIIPNIGGGLCQISNALYDAALQANFEIIERHAHTRIVPGSLAEMGRDATVFWNYVDLRFRSDQPFRIEVKLDSENLTVRFRGEKREFKTLHQIKPRSYQANHPQTCATCEVGDCHRVIKPATNKTFFGRSAFLLDGFSPEFDEYVKKERVKNDLLLIPLDGKRFRKANYAWSTAGFDRVSQSLIVTAIRSYRSRRLAAQGAARQLNLLAMYEALAENYARKLRYDVLHVTVDQNLLPFLWKNGHLGGRSFDVLMTALPIAEIQKRLDHAYLIHFGSTTLGDFRADAELIAAETEALDNARKIITPHSDIAALFPDKAECLAWSLPQIEIRENVKTVRPAIVFPASTVGRKGCYELREAIRGLDVKLLTMGPDIEGKKFWEGFDVERGGRDCLQHADLVVLPAFIEHKPRRLLHAVAAGVPVIASKACGLENVDGVETVMVGDVETLRNRIMQKLARITGESG